MLEFMDLVKVVAETQKQAFDNLFSANQRNKMVDKYSYTEAQRITVGELITLTR